VSSVNAHHPYHDRTDLDRFEDLAVARLLERMPEAVRDDVLGGMSPGQRSLVEAAEERGWRDRNEYERDHGEPMCSPLDPARDWAPWAEKFRTAASAADAGHDTDAR
jgi:hypothetical protein